MQHEKKTSADEIIARLDRIIELMEAREGLKENVPPKTPYREKQPANTITACAREEETQPDSKHVPVPTLEAILAYAPTLGLSEEDALDFWNVNEGLGWIYKGSHIENWRPMMKAWGNARKRLKRRDEAMLSHFDAKAEERAAKRTAHIDAKMDEREKKREAKRGSGGGSRRPDNWIEATERERKEFLDGLES